MPSRREIVKSLPAIGAAAALGSTGLPAQGAWGAAGPGGGFDGRALINKPQAYRVLREQGLDGLVALNPVNVFYLGNFLGYNVNIQMPAASFAVFPLDEKKPTILVVGSGDLGQIATGPRTTPTIVPYSMPSNWDAFVGHTAAPKGLQAGPGFGSVWPVDEAGLTPREKSWVAAEMRFASKMMPTPQHALVKALQEAGLAKARVAVDDLRIPAFLASAGHDATQCVEGDNVFRKIRVVKSDVEIGHMRQIAVANQQATMNMIAGLDLGATNADINQAFGVEASKLGAKSTWIAAGSVSGLARGEIVANQPILIDAVSQTNNYHGDFGRTVVFGEPSDKLQARARLLERGWQAALEAIKPGIRYSQIEAVARAAMRDKGVDIPLIGVVPHSVGLQHTDEPYRDKLPFQVKDDLVLEENMTLTVDFPCLEMGWGNCHLEDLVRVTKTGVEPLANLDEPLIVA